MPRWESLYTTVSDEEIIAVLDYSRKHIHQQVLDNISLLATQQISAPRQNKETKVACFTEDIHSAHMWDRLLVGIEVLRWNMIYEILF